MDNKYQQERDEKIKLRSDEFNEIVSMVPHWYERWGIVVIFSFLVLILIGIWFFKYPDIVSAQVDIMANNLPVSIVARSNGRIEKLLVRDNQKVKQDELLAIIENTAEYGEVLAMKKMVESIGYLIQGNDTITLPLLENYMKLGEVQSSYSTFQRQLSDYNNFVKLNYQRKKIASVSLEIKQQKAYLKKSSIRLHYAKELLELIRNQYKRDSLLYKNQVIALADFEKSQNSYLQSKTNFESASSEVLTTELQVTKLNQTILDLESQRLEQTTQQRNSLKERYEVLLSSIGSWEKAYILKSSEEGVITFTRFWNDNQQVKTGENIFTVIPVGSKNHIAKILIPIQSSGKVKVGQKIIIKLNDFPYMEFGFLSGRINKISLVPDNEYYYAEVIFPSKLTTSYGKDISLKKEMKGNGEIVTQNQRLLYKFIYPIKALWDKNRIQ